MTSPLPRPPSTWIVPGLVVAALVAGGAGTAASSEEPTTKHPARVAVIAGPDASATALADALTGAGRHEVRRVGGLLEAQAQAATLAAQGYDTVVGVGAQARAAVAEAREAEVGAGTRWRTAPH
jgi:hypothetical protein